ncbi:MAG TPA: hypothetical protein VMZ52_02525, partial [Bryobacteraceae bacterium]|nr:hypothetical protein [Bryobacteraceae bacterium]
PRVGFLAQADQLQQTLDTGAVAAGKLLETQTQIFNAKLDAALCAIFLILVTTILLDSIRLWIGILRGTREARISETPFVLSTLQAEEL